MEIDNTTLTRVTEFQNFTSAVGVISLADEELLGLRIDIVAPDNFNLGLTKIEIRENLLVGLTGKYTGIFNTEIWYFKKNDIVDLDYSKGAGDPELISDSEFTKLKEKYPDLPVSQPIETNDYLTIPENQRMVAYIQSSELTKTVSYTITIDYHKYIDSPFILPPHLNVEEYNIYDHSEPPEEVDRETFIISQTIDGDTTTARKVINSYYN
jgi:hypothetical protein